MNTNKLQGKVKFYNKLKGFGFITTNDGDIFVHATGLIDVIQQDDNVTFLTKDGKKGLNAIDVELC
jgi:CspA family cold shock protein